jgi:signal transduction histidine kinase
MRAVRAVGADHCEVIIVRAYVLIRVVAVLQPVMTAITSAHHRSSAAAAGLIAVLAVQSAPLITVALIRRQVPPAWLTGLEVAALTGELVAGAHIYLSVYGQTWTYFVYQYSLIVIVGVGQSFRRLPVMFAVAAVPAAVYAVVSITQLGETPWNAALDTAPYLLHSGVAWMITNAFRRSSHEVDLAHRILTDREVELAAERERARHARMLHDRVLQTLEVLGQGESVADPALRGHVRAEAARLRSFVRGEPDSTVTDGTATDLLGALAAVAQEMARSGLAVQLNTAQLANALRWRAKPSAETTQALAGAAREALVNVLKHADTRSAVVHAELDMTTLTVSVLDHGCGFDDRVREPGFGLSTSIGSRIAAVGGEMSIESAPGVGTYLELRVPAPVHASAPG